VTALDFDVAQTTTEARDLPAHLTRFIGREREIADLLPLLASTRPRQQRQRREWQNAAGE
jgi:hypothetical protein